MLLTVIDQMAALAKRLEVFRAIVRRIVIEVGRRKNHLGGADGLPINQRFSKEPPLRSKPGASGG